MKMKTYILGIAVLGFALPFTVFASFDTNLRYGSTGVAVSELQEFLIDQGVLKGQSTGNFYTLTLKAVKAFQKIQGINPQSGYFGPVTRKAANEILTGQLSDSEGNATTSQQATDLSQQQNSTSWPSGIPKVVILPNGAVIKFNSDGTVVSYTAPPVSVQIVPTTPAPTPTPPAPTPITQPTPTPAPVPTPEPVVPQPVLPQKPTKPTLVGTPKLTFSNGEEKILMALDFTVSEGVICKWGPNYYSTPRQPEITGSVCSVSQGAIRDLLPKESCNQNGVYAPWEGGFFMFKSGQTYTCNLHLTAYPDTQRVNTEADFTFTVE